MNLRLTQTGIGLINHILPKGHARRPKLLLASMLLAVVIVVGNLSIMLFVMDEARKLVLIDVTYPLWDLWAVLGLGWAAQRSACESRRLALAWGILALAPVATGIGNSLWAVLELGQGEVPFPSLADGAYLAAYPLFLAGVLLLPVNRWPPRPWLTTALDLLIAMLATTLAFWHYVLGPTLAAGREARLLAQLVGLAYPLGDLVLLWALLVLVYRQVGGQRAGPLWLVAVGFGGSIVADSLYSAQALTDTYVSAALLDISWVVINLLYGVAGVWQATSRPPAPPLASGTGLSSRLNPWLTYLPYAWAIATYFLFELHMRAAASEGVTWLSWGVGLVIGLVLVRQLVTLRENRLLFGQAQDALAQVQRQAQTLHQTNHALQVEIGERQQVEAALRRTHEQYRRAIAAIDAVPYERDYRTDSFIFLGDAIQAITGYSAAEMTPARLEEISLETVMRGETAGLSKAEAMRRTRLGEFHRWRCDSRLLTRRGAECWIADASVELCDEQGTPTGSIGLLMEITERKRAEEELRKQKELLQTIFDHIPVMLTLVGADGHIQRVNRAWEHTLGWSLTEVQQHNLDILTECYPDPHYRHQVLTFLATSTGQWADFQTRVKDARVIETTWATVHLSDGTRVGIGQDITARKRVEADLARARDQALEAARVKSEFLATMSHEIRTPLNAILGFVQLLNRDPALTAGQREPLAVIERSGHHLLTLINDVLDMAKIEAARLTLHATDFDLYHLLSTLAELFRRRAEDKGLQFSTAYDASLPRYIRTDERKVRQILINLLGNAVKFTPAGAVRLQVQYEPAAREVGVTSSRLTFAVADTGVGIREGDRARIFEAFVQTDSSQRTAEGAGLGLAISRALARVMGGDLTVRSQVGKGSTFTLCLPMAVAETADVPEEPPRRVLGLAPGQAAYRLLVVEDRTENRVLLHRLLAMVGFDVQVASHGQAAIAVWESWQPHLIWMDLRMPVMNGFEAARHIKGTVQGQATVIVALTASVFEEERVAVLSAGFDDFVRKPFREHEIFEKITRYLGVQYVYEERTAPVPLALPTPPDALRTAVLALPAALQTALREATRLADFQQQQQLVAQIRDQHNPRLAAALAELVNTFAYDDLLAILSQAERG